MGKKEIALGPNEVICQKWEERERGWGERPDGFSLHVSFEALKAYISRYWDTMPSEVPDEYSRPNGTPYPVGVSNEVYAEVVAMGGLRFYADYQYPGTAGLDGWMPARPE